MMTIPKKYSKDKAGSLQREVPMFEVKRVILLGRKCGLGQAYSHLVEQGITVPILVVMDDNAVVREMAERHGTRVLMDDAELYRLIEQGDDLVSDIDLVISWLFPKRIKEPLFKLGRLGCLNLHPAPLPDYKSRAGYNTAILERRKEFGVSVHYIDSEQFDAGPIIDVLRWPIDPEHETVLTLESATQEKLLELFQATVARFVSSEAIATTANLGGLYLSAKQLEAAKEIDLERDSLEEINRKIRAFFFPPHAGAYIMVHGQKFTLVNQAILDLLAKRLTH